MICPKNVSARILPVLILLFCSSASMAVDIPQQLEPWAPWVLHDQDERFCTSSFDGAQRFCVWPEPLNLELRSTGGRFSQKWQMKNEGWVVLPGQEKYWPKNVLINNKAALVVNNKGVPVIYIDAPGTYAVEGEFSWHSLPESMRIPAGTAIIAPFTVNGEQRLADVTGDTLWLSRKSADETEKEQDVVHTRVYRHIKDTIPVLVTSHIDLQISGTPREILVDWQLPDNQIPVELQCPLPVKIGPDGRIHMQARPGKYTIIYKARSTGPVDVLRHEDSPLGPDTEYWSFESQNQLRMVKISGVPAVDPSQTTIPVGWHAFPAYQVNKGESMVFETLKRGNPEPAPNNLSLHRTFWLDSDGTGITVQDSLSGTVYRDPRLEMQPPAELGRMVINGRDQLITRVKEGEPAGVEVRQGRINAMAVSRIEGTTSFPAGGWNQNIQLLTADLVLQPGWKIFHARGVDSVRSWISRWTLLDCFIVLIIVITTFKLLGPFKGMAALVGLVLSYHDREAPVFLWLAILTCIAIIRAAPELKFIKFIKGGRLLLLIGLVVMLLPYSVTQLREGFYPQLEKVHTAHLSSFAERNTQMERESAVMESKDVVQSAEKYATKGMRYASPAKTVPDRRQQLVQQYDTQSKVQAGPGVPDKIWRVVRLTWNGPVDSSLNLQLFLISPLVNLLLILLKVAALFLLAFFMADLKRNGEVKFQLADAVPGLTKVIVFFLLLSGASVPAGWCGDYPSQELLDTLRARLTEPPKCFPNCADFDSMQIDLKASKISISITANASSISAVPLPKGEGIFWQSLHLDDNMEPAFTEKGNLWFTIPEGQHTISMVGLINRADLQLDLPLKPHAVHFEGHGEWSIAGLDVNNVPTGRLQLVKQEKQDEQSSFGTSTLPPLLKVERNLQLGLQWHVETIVTRLSPKGTSVYVKIPLLEGESVTNGEYKVKNNTIEVNFSPGDTQKRWSSVFKQQSSITLAAPDTTEWNEVWRLNASPIWHVEAAGLTPIHHHSGGGTWQPEWHPWAQEQITLDISRPEGIEGETKTIESSIVKIKPGIRSTGMSLSFIIRSTRGDQQNVTLPDNAVIQSIKINGREQPTKKDNTVVLPLAPGSQRVEINWNSPDGIATLFRVPKIDLGSDSVNSNIEIQIGSRWVWFVKGPKMGPAILFYSELLIILLAAVVLGLSQMTPLNILSWLVLGLGLSQSGLVPCLIIVVWFIALRLRCAKGSELSGGTFNAMQLLLVLLTLVAFGAIIFAVQNGLLGHPDMLIAGNGSNSYLLRWYQDRVTGGLLPQPLVVSIPIMAYRVLMLIWALWLAFNMLKWTKWGWQCFTREKSWVEAGFRLKKKTKDEK